MNAQTYSRSFNKQCNSKFDGMTILSNYKKLLQIDALTSILIHLYEAFILQLPSWLAFYSHLDHFYAKCIRVWHKWTEHTRVGFIDSTRVRLESIMLQNLLIMLFGISVIFCLCLFLCFLGTHYADNAYLYIIVHFCIKMIMIGVKYALQEQLQYKGFLNMYQNWCQCINIQQF